MARQAVQAYAILGQVCALIVVLFRFYTVDAVVSGRNNKQATQFTGQLYGTLSSLSTPKTCGRRVFELTKVPVLPISNMAG